MFSGNGQPQFLTMVKPWSSILNLVGVMTMVRTCFLTIVIYCVLTVVLMMTMILPCFDNGAIYRACFKHVRPWSKTQSDHGCQWSKYCQIQVKWQCFDHGQKPYKPGHGWPWSEHGQLRPWSTMVKTCFLTRFYLTVFWTVVSMMTMILPHFDNGAIYRACFKHAWPWSTTWSDHSRLLSKYYQKLVMI